MVIGIRREDKNRWERRVPLTPEDVGRLIADRGFEFHVQPSPIRVFSDERYKVAGARILEDLSGCDLILGVKEVPIPLLLPRKAYMFFSHTVKGQAYNMPLLRRLLESGCSLLDHELVTDERNRRLLFFGRFAGLAGMIDTLHSLGRRLALEGIPSPFARIRMAHEYQELAGAELALAEVAEEIRTRGLDPRVTPLVVGFSGYGHVSSGAQEIVDLLPAQTIAPEELPGLRARADLSPHTVYKVVFREEDLVEPREPGQRFELQDYYDHPERYRGVFDRYTPQLSVFVNGIFWTEKYPRLITRESIARLYAGPATPHLRVIGDISCDIEGSVEVTVKVTDPECPAFVYEAATGKIRDGFAGRGPVVMAVDNLPCELPAEASRYFSEQVHDMLDACGETDLAQPADRVKMPEALRRSIIAWQGALLPRFEYLSAFLNREGTH
jgi:saccharopine dehydrogenase (NAD+, L-lysine forming)